MLEHGARTAADRRLRVALLHLDEAWPARVRQVRALRHLRGHREQRSPVDDVEQLRPQPLPSL
jgi:hypothetical protein